VTNQQTGSKVSKGARQMMAVFAAVCAVNYFASLAWGEFYVVAAGILFLVGMGLLYIFLREGVNFLTGGRRKMVMSASSIWVLGGSFALTVGLYRVALAGPESLVGTRGSGVSLPILMFVVTLLTAAVGAIVIAFVREPVKMQAAMMQAAIDRGQRR